MSETVADIRQWYYGGAFIGHARPYRDWIGTLLAEIERLKGALGIAVSTTKVLQEDIRSLQARLDRALAVCEACRVVRKFSIDESSDGRAWSHACERLRQALDAHLAGEKKDDE